MAFSSRITYISASAATLTYAFSFDYIDSSYVKVYFDDVLQSGVTVTTGLVTLTTGADPGVEVLIQRETPTTPLVDFVDGAVLTENDLDLLAKQALHVSIEAKDDSVNGLQLNAAGDAYDANSKKIENLAAPTAANDAARKSETDALDTRVTAAESSITTLEGSDVGHAMVTNASNRWDAESRLIKNVADGVDAQDAVSKNQLDTLAVSRGNASTDFTAQSKRILNLATPINDTDAATKKYVDDNAGGGGSSTLQDAYDNSTSPEILTDATNGALSVKRGSAADTDNVVEVLNNAGTVTAAIAGDGTITTSSTVDGRDIATDGTKLDGIETGADVTDATNVNAAGAVMESDFSSAKTILVQQSGTGSPETLSVSQNTLVGRGSGGASTIDALGVADVQSMLNVEDGATADQTDAEIKTAYENNADTNAFTDAEKTKLSGIETGAEVNDTKSELETKLEGFSIGGNNEFLSTDAGSSAAPELSLRRNSASPADGDYLGQLRFDGRNSSGTNKLYAKMTGKTSDVTAGTEDGLIETAVMKAGTQTIVARQTHSALKLLNGTGLEVAGNITVDGTVDGRDVATDGTKLDGIESNATADQTDAEIETAYNNQVAVGSQAQAEDSSGTTAYRWTGQRLSQAVNKHAVFPIRHQFRFHEGSATFSTAQEETMAQAFHDLTIVGMDVWTTRSGGTGTSTSTKFWRTRVFNGGSATGSLVGTWQSHDGVSTADDMSDQFDVKHPTISNTSVSAGDNLTFVVDAFTTGGNPQSMNTDAFICVLWVHRT